jgi:hypothetical protein
MGCLWHRGGFMHELTIVWRNPEPVRRLQARRIQKYDFDRTLYGVQELVSPGSPDLWLTTSAFEVRTFYGRKISPAIRAPGDFTERSASLSELQTASGGE